MASYNKYTSSALALGGTTNAATCQWAICLASTVNAADTSFVAGTTDLATGGGYTQGGNNVTTTSFTQSGGVAKLILTDPSVWTASGGGFTFRYALLVDKTNNIPHGYWDYGSSQAVAAGETVTVDLDATNGVFTIT